MNFILLEYKFILIGDELAANSFYNDTVCQKKYKRSSVSGLYMDTESGNEITTVHRAYLERMMTCLHN